MLGIIGKTAAFIRWLFTPEQLPGPPSARQGSGRPRRRSPRRLFAADDLPRHGPTGTRTLPRQGFLSWLFSSEAPLPLPTGSDGRGRRRSGRWHRAMRTDTLPRLNATTDPEKSRTSGLRWLLSAEVCPRRPVSAERRQSVVRLVFSAESCPQAQPSVRRRRGGGLSWLVSSEQL